MYNYLYFSLSFFLFEPWTIFFPVFFSSSSSSPLSEHILSTKTQNNSSKITLFAVYFLRSWHWRSSPTLTRSSYGRIGPGLSHQQQRQLDQSLRQRRQLPEWHYINVTIPTSTSSTFSTTTVLATTTTANSTQLQHKTLINTKSSICFTASFTYALTDTFNFFNIHSSDSNQHSCPLNKLTNFLNLWCLHNLLHRSSQRQFKFNNPQFIRVFFLKFISHPKSRERAFKQNQLQWSSAQQ